MIANAVSASLIHDLIKRHAQIVSLEKDHNIPIENLVFEGGGVKGIAYAGTVQALEEHNILSQVKRVAGSSAGGITAMLLSLGFQTDEIKTILLEELDLKQLMDKRVSWDPTRQVEIKGLTLGLSDLVALMKHKGIYKGEAFVEITRQLIRRKILDHLTNSVKDLFSEELSQFDDELQSHQKNAFIETQITKILSQFYITDPADLTLEQLHKLSMTFPEWQLKSLYVTGTSLTDASLKVFSHETDPNMKIVDAVRITMSFPLGFEPVLYQGHYYVDGGVADNYPMHIFNAPQYLSHGRDEAGVNPCTLGFLVDSEEEIAFRWGQKYGENKSLSIEKFVTSLLKGMHNRTEVLRDLYNVRSIQIPDLGVSVLNFKVDKKKKLDLINSGYQSTKQYLDLYHGDHIVQTHLLQYEDVEEKYYSQSQQALIRLIENELWPHLNDLHILNMSLQAFDFYKQSKEIETALSQVPEKIVQQAQQCLDRVFAIESDLAWLENEIEKKPENIDLIKQYNHCLEELKALSINEHSAVITLLNQQHMFGYFEDGQLQEHLKTLELECHAHLDMALKALQGYQRHYPDPRTSDHYDKTLYVQLETVYNRLMQVLTTQHHVSQEEAADKVSELIALVEGIMQLNISLEKAQEYAEQFLSRAIKEQGFVGKEEQDTIIFRMITEAFDHNHTLPRLPKVKKQLVADTFKNALLDHYQQSQDWARAMLRAKESASEYAIVLARLPDSVKDDSLAKQDATERVRYSNELQAMSQKLLSGKWGDHMTLETFEDVRHNHTLTTSFGTHQTNHHVVEVSKKEFVDIDHSLLDKPFGLPALQCFILTPEDAYLKNPNHREKEIIITFPNIFNKDETFGQASLSQTRRKQQFHQCREEIIKQLAWRIRRAKETAVPEQSAYAITIHGESLGGQDAQYFFQALIEEISKQDGMIGAADVASINLVLVDSTRIEMGDVVQTTDMIKQLKHKPHSPRIQGFNIFNQSKDSHNQWRNRKQTFIGQANILSMLDKNDALIFQDMLDKHNEKAPIRSLSNENGALYDTLNESRYLYSKPILLYVYLLLKRTNKLGRYFFMDVAPAIILFIAQLPLYLGYKLIKRLSNPILYLLKRYRRKPIRMQQQIDWLAKLAQSHSQVTSQGRCDKPTDSCFINDNLEKGFDDNKLFLQKFIEAHGVPARLSRTGRPPIENLVLEGGGVKSLAYLGALESMQQHGLLSEFKRIAGSSSGTILSALLAVGYTPEELKRLLIEELDFQDYLDEPFHLGGLDHLFRFRGTDVSLTGIINLFIYKGLYKGDRFSQLMQRLIKQKLTFKLQEWLLESLKEALKQSFLQYNDSVASEEQNHMIQVHLDKALETLLQQYGIDDLGNITLGQLKVLRTQYPELGLLDVLLTATDMQNGAQRVFGCETDPSIPLFKAVRIGMSFPGGFMPVQYEGRWYADGGIANNYPMEVFDKEPYLTHGRNDAGVNPCTLGLLTDSPDEMKSRWGLPLDVTNKLELPNFIHHVLGGLHNRSEILRDKYNINSVQISENIRVDGESQSQPSLELTISKLHKNLLINNGYDALEQYYDLYHKEPIQYHHVSTYDNLHQKYYAKTLSELYHVLENECEPLLEQCETVLPYIVKWRQSSKADLALLDQFEALYQFLLKEKSIALKAVRAKGGSLSKHKQDHYLRRHADNQPDKQSGNSDVYPNISIEEQDSKLSLSGADYKQMKQFAQTYQQKCEANGQAVKYTIEADSHSDGKALLKKLHASHFDITQIEAIIIADGSCVTGQALGDIVRDIRGLNNLKLK